MWMKILLGFQSVDHSAKLTKLSYIETKAQFSPANVFCGLINKTDTDLSRKSIFFKEIEHPSSIEFHGSYEYPHDFFRFRRNEHSPILAYTVLMVSSTLWPGESLQTYQLETLEADLNLNPLDKILFPPTLSDANHNPLLEQGSFFVE